MVIFSKHKKTEKKGVNILGIKCFTFDLPTRRHLFPKLAASKTSGHRSKFHWAKPCTDGTAMGGEPPIVFGASTGWTVGSGSEASEMASEAADGGVGLFVGGEKGSWKTNTFLMDLYGKSSFFDGFFRIWKISSFFNSTSTHLIPWMFQTGHV